MTRHSPLFASVQIPTWRRRERLATLIDCLANQTAPLSSYEIVVCDSGSGDGTREMMQERMQTLPNLRFLDITTNTLAAKRNALFYGSDAPVVILLDDDLTVNPEFVAAHVAAHASSTRTVFCGDVRFPPEWTSHSNYYRWRESRHIGETRPEINQEDISARHLVVMNFSAKRAEVAPLGFMSEEFRRYGCEDHEFGYRVKQAGLRVQLVKEAVCWHYEGTGDRTSIAGYEKKAYTMMRYGMPVLQNLAPEAAHGSWTQLLEPAQAADPFARKVLKQGVQLALRPGLSRQVRKFLERVDATPAAYFPWLYQYVISTAMLQGRKERSPADWTEPSEFLKAA